MDDSMLDISDDKLLVKETQLSTSPKSFSKRLINCLGINNQQGPGTEIASLSENIPYT